MIDFFKKVYLLLSLRRAVGLREHAEARRICARLDRLERR